MRKLHSLLILAVLSACSGSSGEITDKQFRELLHSVSQGWNNGDARAAADCFASDAVYIEPPDQQLYLGRDELFEFFGGLRSYAHDMAPYCF